MPVSFRLTVILIIFSTAAAIGQVERAQRPPDLSTGLIGEWPHPVGIADAVQFPLVADASALGDVALAFELQLQDAGRGDKPQRLLSLEPDGALSVWVAPDGSIICRHGENVEFGAPLPAPGQPRHIVVNIRRDQRQARSGIWIDGVESASVVIRPGQLQPAVGRLAVGGDSLHGSVSRLRLYSRALERPEILALALSSGGNEAKPAGPAFTDSLEFRDGEVIALLGGTDAVALAEDPRFEAMMHLHTPGKRLRFRNLAWEADTVFRQDRPLGFGDLSQQLQRVEPTCILLMFGGDECLEHREAVPVDFEAAMDRLLAACREHTLRLVVIGAARFEPKAPPLPDLSSLNPLLQHYNQLMERAAKRHQALFIDLWSCQAPTVDGAQLAPSGLLAVAQAVLPRSPLRTLQIEPTALDRLLEPIAQKNRLWHDYWRPSNWAFLHGDRTAQPSSRDHLDPTKRWFPGELEKYHALIEAKEQEIWKLAGELGRKLP